MWSCEQCGIAANIDADDFPLTCACGVRYEVGESRGLGDTVAKLARAVGVRPCGGCKQRQKKLNQIFPYQRAGPRGV